MSTSLAPARPAPIREAVVDAFCKRVESLPGILAVIRLAEGTVRVHVSDRRGPIGDAVRDLEEQVMAQFPDQRLDVWISESPVAAP